MKALALAAVLGAAITVSVTPPPSGLQATDVWTATIGVRPPAGPVSVRLANGSTFAAQRLGSGRYRARVVFPSAGRWRYAVRVGSRTARRGTARVAPIAIRSAGDVAVAGGRIVIADASGRVLGARGGALDLVARLGFPVEVAPDPRGGIGVVHAERYVRNVAPDGSVRLVVELEQPTSLAYAPDGTLYVAEIVGRVRRVGLDGVVTTIVGSSLNRPHGLAVVGGTLYVGDTFDNELLGVDLATGTVRTVTRELHTPVDVAAAPDGTLVVADYGNGRIARVTPGGVATTVAALVGVNSVWVDRDGTVLATERDRSRVRRVDPSTGEITTVVGR